MTITFIIVRASCIGRGDGLIVRYLDCEQLVFFPQMLCASWTIKIMRFFSRATEKLRKRKGLLVVNGLPF